MRFTAVISSHTEVQSVDLFRHNPYIDEVATFTYGHPRPWGWDRELHVAFNHLWNLLDEDMPFYLDAEEQNVFNGLPRPFVTLHPFAGDSNRRLDSMINVEDFVDCILECTRMPVVVLGGSHVRGNACVGEADLCEEWTYQRPGVISLANRASARLSARVAQDARCFIGAHSCWMMAAWAKRVPTFVMAPDEITTYLSHGIKPASKIKTPYLDHLFLPRNLLMMHNQAPHYKRFLKHFFRSLEP